MRSLVAALRTLVLPGGATTGPRIVLNGVAGRIELYNAAGQLYGRIDPSSGFSVFDPATVDRFVQLVTDPVEGPFVVFGQDDAALDSPGYIQHYVSGAGGTRNLVLELGAGRFTTSNLARLLLTSESENGTEPGEAQLVADGGLRIRPDAGSATDYPRFAIWTATGTLDAGGNIPAPGILATPITSTNVLKLHGRWTDAAGNSSEFGNGLIVNNAGTIANFGGPGGANRPYRVTALYTP